MISYCQYLVMCIVVTQFGSILLIANAPLTGAQHNLTVVSYSAIKCLLYVGFLFPGLFFQKKFIFMCSVTGCVYRKQCPIVLVSDLQCLYHGKFIFKTVVCTLILICWLFYTLNHFVHSNFGLLGFDADSIVVVLDCQLKLKKWHFLLWVMNFADF